MIVAETTPCQLNPPCPKIGPFVWKITTTMLAYAIQATPNYLSMVGVAVFGRKVLTVVWALGKAQINPQLRAVRQRCKQSRGRCVSNQIEKRVEVCHHQSGEYQIRPKENWSGNEMHRGSRMRTASALKQLRPRKVSHFCNRP